MVQGPLEQLEPWERYVVNIKKKEYNWRKSLFWNFPLTSNNIICTIESELDWYGNFQNFGICRYFFCYLFSGIFYSWTGADSGVLPEVAKNAQGVAKFLKNITVFRHPPVVVLVYL